MHFLNQLAPCGIFKTVFEDLLAFAVVGYSESVFAVKAVSGFYVGIDQAVLDFFSVIEIWGNADWALGSDLASFTRLTGNRVAIAGLQIESAVLTEKALEVVNRLDALKTFGVIWTG